MKICSDCNSQMIENVNLHTNYVGGAKREEQIFVSYKDERKPTQSIFGFETSYNVVQRVKARVCPNCGKVEFYIDLN